MTPLRGTSRSLIEAARAAERPSDADRARVRARVMAKVAGAGAAAVAVTAASEAVGHAAAGSAAAGSAAAAGGAGSAVVAAGATSGVLKAIAIGAIAGVCTIGATQIAPAPRSPATTARVVASAAPTMVVATARPAPRPTPVEVPTPSASVPVVPSVASGVRVEAKPAPSSGIREEIEVLKEAQRAIAAGETDRAMKLLDEHAHRFQGGALAEERLAARAIALCEARRGEAAKRAAARFYAEAKGSPLEGRVRAACAGVAQEEK